MTIFSLMSVGWGQDTTPPELIDFSIFTRTIDVSETIDSIEVSYQVTDDLSGFERMLIYFENSQSNDGVENYSSCNNYNQNEGTLEYSNNFMCYFPTGLTPGTWNLEWVRVEDVSENRRYYYYGELEELFDIENEFEVINDTPIDVNPPELIDFSIFTRTIDVSETIDSIEVSYQVTDDLSGFERMLIYFENSQSNDGVENYSSCNNYNQNEGTLEYSNNFMCYFPTGLTPGTWNLELVRVEDVSDNTRYYYSEELEELFDIENEFEVINDNSICDGSGDFNDDGNTNVTDIVYLVNCLLFDSCIDECSDINNSGSIDVIDVIILVNLILEQ